MFSINYLMFEKMCLWQSYYMLRSSRITHGSDFMNHAKMFRIQQYLMRRIAQNESEITHILHDHYQVSRPGYMNEPKDGQSCEYCKVPLPELNDPFIEIPVNPQLSTKSVFDKPLEYGDIFGDIE